MDLNVTEPEGVGVMIGEEGGVTLGKSVGVNIEEPRVNSIAGVGV
jgi:hypothetical protein